MAFLRGIETLAIGKQKTVDLFYEGSGQWVDKEGAEVKVADVTCYDCLSSYYVLGSDPIDFCPHCGYRKGAVWAQYEQARNWAMKHDWAWMRALGRVPVACRRGDGSWLLAFAPSAEHLLRGGRFVQARELVIDDRQVAESGADNRAAGFGVSGGRSGASGVAGAFGAGADDWGLEID
ncbi:MAG TPA: hypothetical protein DCQ06_12390 [Myxococcales bacterium]|nr:hypothetical protein [Myxococcales bacterium]HAN32385.1 hypothetical protein [Myxococcales bacterium]